jgi:hypothetical protein
VRDRGRPLCRPHLRRPPGAASATLVSTSSGVSGCSSSCSPTSQRTHGPIGSRSLRLLGCDGDLRVLLGDRLRPRVRTRVRQGGLTLGSARIAHRVWQVYWAHIGIFVAIVATLAAADGAIEGARYLRHDLILAPFSTIPPAYGSDESHLRAELLRHSADVSGHLGARPNRDDGRARRWKRRRPRPVGRPLAGGSLSAFWNYPPRRGPQEGPGSSTRSPGSSCSSLASPSRAGGSGRRDRSAARWLVDRRPFGRGTVFLPVRLVLPCRLWTRALVR